VGVWGQFINVFILAYYLTIFIYLTYNNQFYIFIHGSSIYAEIQLDAIPNLKPYLQEGKIVYISKIIIERAKPDYKVVNDIYMVKLNKRT
jgi:hypothetical protein